jgi:parvulin-like peptidyl-prolyl isomerase
MRAWIYFEIGEILSKETSMKNILVLWAVLVFGFFGCAQKGEEFQIQSNTLAFQLAKDLSEILPALDPDKMTPLIVTNTFKVTAAEVIQYLQSSLGNQTSELKGLEPGQLKDVIERGALQVAERKLLLEAALAAKTDIPNEEFEAALNAQYARAGGAEPFQKLLTDNGIDLEHFKENVRSDLVIQNYLSRYLGQDFEVTEEEIQKAYLEDKTATVRHILLLTQDKTEDEKADIHKNMEDILARAKNGEDFAELAKQFTEDPGSQENGGLYEDFGRGYMVKEFEEAAFTVPVGGISEIVETEYGFHIIKVLDRKKEIRPLDEVRAEIQEKVRQEKQAENFEIFLTGLKEKSAFEIVDF